MNLHDFQLFLLSSGVLIIIISVVIVLFEKFSK